MLTNQISVWVLHGLLLDRSDEFFIMTTPGSGEPAASESSALTATLMRSWGSFSINQELLPSSLSLRLADKVGRRVNPFLPADHRRPPPVNTLTYHIPLPPRLPPALTISAFITLLVTCFLGDVSTPLALFCTAGSLHRQGYTGFREGRAPGQPGPP